MTYCLALRLDEGLLFMSDTRTNAGVDNVSTFRKLHVLRPSDDRVFVLQSAGNLATTHEVLDRIDRDLAGEGESLATVTRLFEAALYVGGVGQEVAAAHRAGARRRRHGDVHPRRPDRRRAPGDLPALPGGQLHPASDDVPFLQIGEAKYGKFFLELAVRAHVDLELAGKIALSAMMSTARANLSVGPPYDVAVYLNGSLEVPEVRVEATSPYLAELAEVWNAELLRGDPRAAADPVRAPRALTGRAVRGRSRSRPRPRPRLPGVAARTAGRTGRRGHASTCRRRCPIGPTAARGGRRRAGRRRRAGLVASGGGRYFGFVTGGTLPGRHGRRLARPARGTRTRRSA